MGLKRRFKIRKQQRWKRRKIRQKLAAKNKKVQQSQVTEQATPLPTTGEVSTKPT